MHPAVVSEQTGDLRLVPKGELKPEQFPKAVVEALRREGQKLFWDVLKGGGYFFLRMAGFGLAWVVKFLGIWSWFGLGLGVSDHFVSNKPVVCS